MKTIVVPIPDPIKAKLDAMRAKGYTINGYVRGLLERALASPDELNTEHLTKKQILRIEEAMNTEDLEQVVAVVDAIVGRSRTKAASNKRKAA
jgi:hypothetical protein